MTLYVSVYGADVIRNGVLNVSTRVGKVGLANGAGDYCTVVHVRVCAFQGLSDSHDIVIM